MPHKPTHTQSIDKAFAHYRNQDHKAFRHTKQKSYYPFGRKTGADNIISEAYRENFDRIFGKGGGHGQEEEKEGLLGGDGVQASAPEPNDYDDGDKPRKQKESKCTQRPSATK